MLASTTFDIPGHEIAEHKGLVRGIIVRSPTISQGILGGLKNIIGGQIGAYTTMCEQTRGQAFEQMERHAAELGANAIIGVRYDASSVEPRGGAVEVLCYGTAVLVRRK
ncbi:MAG: YbjQ family protein [Lacunisphaera sp.]|nr:YbjQ family protein [Lacunisphaera sp.]